MQRRGPGVDIRVRVNRDRHVSKLGDGDVTKRRIDALPADRVLEAVGDFKSPQRRDDSAGFGRPIEQGVGFWCPLILKIPTECQRGSEHEAHRRPSLMRFLILRPPMVTPRLISRIRWAASRAISRLTTPFGGTRRATSLP